MAYTAGSAQISVTPDFRGWHTKSSEFLKSQDAEFAKAGKRWGSLAADGFKAGFGKVSPDIRPKVDDAAAKTELDKLARTRSTGVRASVDDTVAKTELDRLTRNRRTKVTVDVDTSSLSKLQRALGGLFGVGKGGAGAGPSGFSFIPGGVAGLAGIAAAIDALLPEVVALGSGFAAAGAGAGAFAALAIPSFHAVSGAYQNISKDQKAYDDALTKTARNTAAKKLAQDWAALDPAERNAVRGIQSLTGEYHNLSRAFEPQVMKIFNDGLSIANQLLPRITPFANSFAGALDGLLKQFGKFTQSKGFTDWLSQFGKVVGPSITAIGEGIGKLVPAFGKLLTVFSAKDDVNAINIAFTVLTGTIGTLAYMANRLRTNWDSINSTFDTVRHTLATAGHDIASGFLGALQAMLPSVQAFTHVVLDAFGGIVHGADIAFGRLPGLGWLKTADTQFGAFRRQVDASFTSAEKSVSNWKRTLDAAPKTAKIRADITDLQRKLATAQRELKNPKLSATQRAKLEAVISDLQAKIVRAKALLSQPQLTATKIAQLKGNIADLQAKVAAAKRQLADPHLTATKRAYLQAEIGQLQAAIRLAQAQIDSVRGKTVYVNVVERANTALTRGQAFIGAGFASGTRNAPPGWAWVGEKGPELAQLTGGETIIPADLSARVARGFADGLNVPQLSLPAVPQVRGGDGLALRVSYEGPSNGAIAAIVRDLRFEIQHGSGGDVQRFLGKGGVRT